MSTYIAERYLPGVTTEQLLDAARRAEAAAGEMTTAGTPGSYLWSTFRSGTRPATACSKARHPGGRASQRQGLDPNERIVHVVPVASDGLA
jgi:hypothetical protein